MAATPSFGSYAPLHVDAAGGELAVVWHRVEGVLYVFSLRDGAFVQKVDLNGDAGTVLFNDALGVFWGDSYDRSTETMWMWQWSATSGKLRYERLPARTISKLLQSDKRRFVVYLSSDGRETVFEQIALDLGRDIVSKWPYDDPKATVWFLGQDVVSEAGAPDVIDVRQRRKLTPVAPENEKPGYAEWVVVRDRAGEWFACEASRFVCAASLSPEKVWAHRGEIPVRATDAHIVGLFADPFDAQAIYATVVVNEESEMVELWRTRDGARTWTTSGKHWKVAGVNPRVFFTADALWIEVAAAAEKELRLVGIDRDLCGERELLLRFQRANTSSQ